MLPVTHVNSIFNSMTYRIGKNLVDCGYTWNDSNCTACVLLIHAHFDHIYGLNDVWKANPNVKVYTNGVGREMLLVARKNLSVYHLTPFAFEAPENIIIVKDGEEIDIGDGIVAKAVFTPGHNPSCITWIIDDTIVTGDSYIPGIKTITNLPKVNKQQAAESEKLILKLAESKTIYTGHS